MEFKAFFASLAMLLLFVGYIPYLRDAIRGTTRPHVFSFFIAMLVTSTLFFLQLSAGAGIGAWITGSVGFISLTLVLLGLRHGSRDIAKSDVFYLVLALVGLSLWLIADQPLLSTILLVATGILGFIPTLRKSWHDPNSETLSLWVVSAVRHGLSIFALVEINLITVLFPLVWVLVNTFMSAVLVMRRKKLSSRG